MRLLLSSHVLSAINLYAQGYPDIPMATNKKKPSIVTVTFTNNKIDAFSIVDTLSWAIMWDTVLQISTKEKDYYYPLDTIRNWTIEEDHGAIREKEESHRPVLVRSE